MTTEIIFSILVNILSPFIPFLTGIILWKKLDRDYYPLIAIFGCAFLAESVRGIQLANYYGNYNLNVGLSLISYNLYVLAIGILYTILFKNWGLFRKGSLFYKILLVLLVLIWVGDHIVFDVSRLHKATKNYRLFYSVVLCLFSIQHMNKLIVQEKGNLLRNASFLVCLCILFFFVPYIIQEGVFIFDSKNSPTFIVSIFSVRKWLNPLIYLTFTLAVIWIPKKKPFIQLS